MEYVSHLLVLAAIYTILVVSLDLLIGHTGIMSVAHASLFGLGAYTTALLAVHYDPPFIIAIVPGMLIGSVVAVIISLASLRLTRDQFVLATFGFQSILFGIFENWVSVTRGPIGVSGIPHPRILGLTASSPPLMLILVSASALLCYAAIMRFARSPFGRVLRAIREDEVFAKSLGKATYRYKISAFAISGCIAALAGGLYAYYMTFIDPTSFTIMESILILSMVIIGGAGSRWGPLVGALVLVILPEGLRFLGLPDAVAGSLRQVIYGVLLIAIVIFRPSGLVGSFRLGR
jgi:branched-chain amino acid transport system permease protein